jgi:hypothetical protein
LKNDQVLGFTIGGVAKSVNEMESAGFTVEFQATEPVFSGEEYDSADGYLDEDLVAMEEGAKFDYKVVISKAGEVVSTSDSKRVTVKAATSGTDAIESYNIYLANADADTIVGGDDAEVKVSSNTLTLNDDAFLRVRGTDSDGLYNSITETAKYSSSDPSIAYVDKSNLTAPVTDGDVDDLYAPIVLGGSTGTVTITVTTSSGVKQTISLKVVDDDRVASASKSVIDKSVAVKLSTDSTQQFGVTVKDQFGDPLKDYAITVKPATSGGKTIATAEVIDYDADDVVANTDKKGRVLVEVTGDAEYGTGTLTIKDEDNNTLGTVSASNTDTAGSASKYKINLLPFEVKELDINDTNTTKYSVDAYDTSGYKLSDAATIPDLTVKVDGKVANDDADVNSYVTVDYDPVEHTILVTGKKIKSGSVTLDVYQGGSSYKLATTTLTVTDQRAKITGATFESNIPAITTSAGIKLSRVLKTANIKTDDSNPVTFVEDMNNANVLLIKGIDGTIIGNLKLSVLDGDLTPTFDVADLDNIKVAVDGDDGENGTIRLSVNKLNGELDANDVPANATNVTSKNLTVTDLNY